MASNSYNDMSELIRDYYDMPVDNYLNRTITINEVSLACDIYRVAADTVLTSSVFTGCTAVDANTQIIIGKNMSVASGTTLTPPYRCKGIVIGDVDEFINEGTISMTARGASGAGKNIQLTTSYMISATGGSGSSATGGYVDYNCNGYSGGAGSSPASGVLSCGGGGGGACAGKGGITFYGGAGGTGTSFSGGSGGGGLITSYANTGNAGSSTGGAGGAGKNGWSDSNTYIVRGGAGNPVGSTVNANSVAADGYGEGTGGLIVIMASKLTNTGTINSKGSKAPGFATATDRYPKAGGGASGGGCIVLLGRSITNTGTVSAAGGDAGDGATTYAYRGGAGGAGASASYIVDNLVLVNLPVEFAITDSDHLENIEPSEAVRLLMETDEDKLYYEVMGTRHEVGLDKQDTLTAGDGIDITGSTISTTQEFTDGTNTITHRDTIQINSPLTIEDNDDDEITEIGVNTDVDFSVFKHPSSETEQSPIIPVKYIYSR